MKKLRPLFCTAGGAAGQRGGGVCWFCFGNQDSGPSTSFRARRCDTMRKFNRRGFIQDPANNSAALVRRAQTFQRRSSHVLKNSHRVRPISTWSRPSRKRCWSCSSSCETTAASLAASLKRTCSHFWEKSLVKLRTGGRWPSEALRITSRTHTSLRGTRACACRQTSRRTNPIPNAAPAS